MSFGSEEVPPEGDPLAGDMPLYVEPTHVNVGPPHGPVEGFPFDKYSPIRRYTEPAGIMLVPFIAGLTVMHDKIAAAVDTHSGFREHPWRRLLGTATAGIKLAFANVELSSLQVGNLWR
jgi:ER-bound oxygenase mpaB/B'/Rubber oxygenase, catalytic domain